MPQLIKPLVAGQTPSLLDTDKANELVDAINSLQQMQVNPQGFGKLTLGDKNIILDLTQIRDLINQLTTTVNAYSQTTGGGGGGGGGGTTDLSAIRNSINGLIVGLANATFNAACDPVTRDITLSMSIILPPLV